MPLKVSVPDQFQVLEDVRLVWLIFGTIETIKHVAITALSRNDIVMIATPTMYYSDQQQSESQSTSSPVGAAADKGGSEDENMSHSWQRSQYRVYEFDAESDLTEIGNAADIAASVTASAASGLDKKGERWNKISCDVREIASVQEAVDKCLLLYGAIDVVVNWMCREPDERRLARALRNPGADVESIEREGVIINNRIEVEVIGLHNMIRATLPELKNSKIHLQQVKTSTSTLTSASTSTSHSASNLNEQDGSENSISTDDSDMFGGTDANSGDTGLPPKFITITNTLGMQAVPEFRAECTVRRAVEGMLASFAIESAEQNVRTVMVDVGIGGLDNQRIADVIWSVGHSVDPFDRVVATENALEAVRKRLRWMVEETEDWKYLFE